MGDALVIHSFPPLVAAGCTRLVVGTMPGKASLAAQQYYAHPRNAFWPIVEQLLGIPRALAYAERTQRLAAAGVAVWDVLKACTRSSSLDADIVTDSMVPNDLAGFVTDYPSIRRIYCNGAAAEQILRRHGLPSLPARISITRLPSTSPANARLTLDQKAIAWQELAND